MDISSIFERAERIRSAFNRSGAVERFAVVTATGYALTLTASETATGAYTATVEHIGVEVVSVYEVTTIRETLARLSEHIGAETLATFQRQYEEVMS